MLAKFWWVQQNDEGLDGMLAKFWWAQQNDEGKIHWQTWGKLTKAKRDGGMGFRGFSCFNLAFLAKQAWRIISNPNDLQVKELQGLYFPNSNLLEDGKGSRASWAQSSILEGRDLLKKGLCWRVGNGSHISIWNDKWIPSLPRFMLSSHPLGESTLSDSVDGLIQDGQWQLESILPWITPEEVRAIILILIWLSQLAKITIEEEGGI